MNRMKTPVFFLVWLFFIQSAAHAFTLESFDVLSAKMSIPITVTIVLPESYKSGEASYPSVYLLHGFGDNNLKWSQETSIGELADLYNIVVVCPDGRRSWYFDSPEKADSQFETFVSKEVVSYIDSHYRTKPSRSARAVAGLSMGGHGAMFLAIRHQDVFGAVAAMSGGVDIRPFPKNWDISHVIGTIEEHPERWEELTVINQAKILKDGDLAISIDCGDGDFFIGVNRALHQQLLDQKVAHDYTERRGVHSWDYWRNSIKYQMLFFSNFFKCAQQ